MSELCSWVKHLTRTSKWVAPEALIKKEKISELVKLWAFSNSKGKLRRLYDKSSYWVIFILYPQNMSQISLFNIYQSVCIWIDFQNVILFVLLSGFLSVCLDYTSSQEFSHLKRALQGPWRVSVSGGEDLIQSWGLHQGSWYPLYNTFSLLGRSFGYGSFILRTEISERVSVYFFHHSIPVSKVSIKEY